MTSSAELSVRVGEEITALHDFFVAWFAGVCEPNGQHFCEEFQHRFDPNFLLVPPAGTLLPLSVLADSVRSRHGVNPAFRIAIRNVRVRREFHGHALATYEEWQRNATASTPPDNGRLATVLFRVSDRLQWLHVHETWLPEEAMTAGPYDF